MRRTRNIKLASRRRRDRCAPSADDRRRRVRSASGFTLVEMLISVALVLLMMSMFAQIFQMAGGTISKQRGLMENDQRARTLQTIIKGDLDKRTFQMVLPFAANEDTTGVEAEISKRRGYFYYSENDPTNQLDDVLQFTVQSTIVIYNKDQSPYYGRALVLGTTSDPTLTTYWLKHPNQPDADDALLVSNNTGVSTLAEVSYFVRNGSLYRRQLLIREPLPIAGASEQPVDADDDDFFDPLLTGSAAPVVLYNPTTVGTTFWHDFDYSAYLRFSGSSEQGAGFLGANALNNDGSATLQMGKPWYRFGHDYVTASPKEYGGTAATAEFIGRYTLQECSDVDFEYPQSRWTGNVNPLALATTLTLDPVDKVVTAPVDLTGGSRRGEDLLLSNVHSFDVQLWDDAANGGQGAFVDIGGTNAVDYAMSNSKHDNPIYGGSDLLYGPTTSASLNRVFDTWHPQFNLTTSNDPSPSPDTSTGQTIYDDPAFRPLVWNAESVTGTASDVDEWEANHTYAVGDIVFPTGPPGSTQASPPYPAGTIAPLPYGLPFYYRCVEASGTGLSDPVVTNEPNWPRIAGLKIRDNETYDTSTTPPTLTNRLVWEAVENRKPLKAIKLEIRFVDTSTQQMRQVTIIQSLVD